MTQKTSQEIKDLIILDFVNTKLTISEIAKNRGVSKSVVEKLLFNNNLRRNNPRGVLIPVNENYFEKIDTVKKATILGMFAADGSILMVKNYENQLKFRLGLKSRDFLYIEQVKKDMESEHTIGFYKNKKINLNGEQTEAAVLLITRSKLCKDLINLGVGRDKSKNLKFPNVEYHFKKFIILGYFCGNGYWAPAKLKNGVKSKPNIVFGLCGPVKSFILECKNFIAQELGLNLEASIYDNKGTTNATGKCWKACFGGNDQCWEIFKWIYKDAEIFLERKFWKAYFHFKKLGYNVDSVLNSLKVPLEIPIINEKQIIVDDEFEENIKPKTDEQLIDSQLLEVEKIFL